MNDRRQHSRYQATSLLEVFEQHSGRYLGRVADISSDGLMLCGPVPQPADTLVECRLVCSTPLDGVSELHFISDCLWSRGGEPGQQCWSGYHIIDIDQRNTEALNALLRHFQACS
ncbi:PilZ domain-containing protein [Pseudomonas seleniipraecipitans]|uniref:PilZ domain-containing protein n=1 Tax=Phytopseudomonas seleniipraecipitans TaxID=640205 RepID=A0ABY5JC99_9GAMM|nr:PilZ domain-containing protein [Pseudomonas seleniipraecipitans]UUD65625.1 PilZ domain-containing protein [Pseudomonas seleniipraecipitans]